MDALRLWKSKFLCPSSIPTRWGRRSKRCCSASITAKSYHRGAFKTPTLRDVSRRGPYMHDGSLATLEDVIEYYDRGGNHNPYLDENIVPLHLSDGEKKALLAFLRTGLAGSV